jgi:cobalt-zinc-cadmium efflux system outer membrane protein
MSETIRVYGRNNSARPIIFLCALACISATSTDAASQESNHAPDMAPPVSTAAVSTPNLLQVLVQEALARSPMITAARTHSEALTKVPKQVSTLPDPQVGLQHFTVGSPQPFSGYETSDFYYSGFGFSQDIPGPGKLGLRAEQAQKEAEAGHHALEVQQRQVAEQVRETYFNLFYLKKTLALLLQTQAELQTVAQTAESQYHVGMAQQQDVFKAQLELTSFLKEIEMHHEEVDQSQANLKAILGREQDSPNIAIGDDLKATELPVDEHRLRELGLSNSPTLKQARAMEERGQAAVEIAKRDYLPDFMVGYTYEKTGPKFRDYYVLSLGAKIPLYFWRKQNLAVEQAVLEKESARADAYSKRLSVMSDLQNQAIALQTTQRVLKLYSEGLIPQANATHESALAAYRVSKVDFQTLLSTVIDVLRLRQEYYRTLADHEIAAAKIQEIIGDHS